jgi:hypothetical protein
MKRRNSSVFRFFLFSLIVLSLFCVNSLGLYRGLLPSFLKSLPSLTISLVLINAINATLVDVFVARGQLDADDASRMRHQSIEPPEGETIE